MITKIILRGMVIQDIIQRVNLRKIVLILQLIYISILTPEFEKKLKLFLLR